MSYQEAKYGNEHGSGHDEQYASKGYYEDDECCNNISPLAAFIIWFIVLIVLIGILRCFKIRWFSAIGFSAVVAAIVLSAIYPFQTHNGKYEYCNTDALYGIIICFTVILIVIWIIWKVFTDIECENQMRDHHHGHHEHHHGQNGPLPDGAVAEDWSVTKSGPQGTTVMQGHAFAEKTTVPSPGLGRSAPLSQVNVGSTAY